MRCLCVLFLIYTNFVIEWLRPHKGYGMSKVEIIKL